MSFTGNEEQQIAFDEGGEITRRYRESMPDDARLGQYFSKDSIMSLLNQPDAVGIRVYFGFDAKKNLEMVLVGVDSNENDLVYVRNVCIETGVSTPPHSSVPNILNS